MDSEAVFRSSTDLKRVLFIVIFAVVVIGGAILLTRKERKATPRKLWRQVVIWVLALLLLIWLAYFTISGTLQIPFLREGFRMVVFSVIIMVVVLFFRRGIMGGKELTSLFRRRKKSAGKEDAQ